MTGQTEAGQQEDNVDPMSMISQNQGTPVAGVLGGQQPERKSDSEAMWDGIMKASSRAKVL